MSLATLAALIVGLCKAVPAAAQLADMVAAMLAEHRRTTAHAQIDADRERITTAPWVCPRTCPHRLLHAQPASPPASAP